MAKCPICKEEFPLLSKICPVCGYVAEDTDASLSADELIDALESSLHCIKNIPEPTFLQSTAQLSYIIFPIITILILILTIISEAGLFAIIVVLFAIFSFLSIRKKIKGILGNDKYNKEFKEQKNAFEYLQRMAKRHYGKNKEVLTLINDITSEIYKIERNRSNATSRNLVIWIVIITLLSGGALYSLHALNKAFSIEEITEETI